MASYGKRMRKRCSPHNDAKFWCETGLDKDGLTKKFIDKYIGMGVFATIGFEKGDFLLEYTGEKISSQEANRREAHGNAYLFGFKYNGKVHWMDASKTRSSRLYGPVNDAEDGSPECNAKMRLTDINGHPRLCLFAQRDIPSGEEIRYDYGDDPSKLTWRNKVFQKEKSPVKL